MRLLLLHPNFPGQFRQRAQDWAADGHDVRFLCQTHYGRQLPGVQRLCLKREAGHEHLEQAGLKGSERSLKMAKQFLAGFNGLRKAGWEPELVLSHTGWGCGLHTSLAFPEARRVGYVEWWFQAQDADDTASHRRNLAQALEIADCDQLIAPTDWQRRQLPRALQARCSVIVDGVNISHFQPNPKEKSGTPLLTYGTRGMEPTRGFPEFIRALPPLLDAVPSLQVEIAGEDRICYSGKPPSGFSGYGAWAQQKLSRWGDRVQFVGILKPEPYRRWLQRSWLHVYLTQPFVASWSLLEAMASGCCLIASNTPPVLEFTGADAARFVDPWGSDRGWLLRAAVDLLTQPGERDQLAKAARTQALGFSHDQARHWWGLVLGQRLATVS